MVKKANSSIWAHLVQTGHGAIINQSFSTIYWVSNFLLKLVRFKVLQTVEAVVIRIKKPELCVQKISSTASPLLANELMVILAIE